MTDIKIQRLNHDEEWLERNPNERWQCDIVADGKDHHGVGSTEAWALFHATQAWLLWDIKTRRMP